VPLLIIGLIVAFFAMAKDFIFDSGYRASAFEMFRQVNLWRLASRVMVAMSAWADKVTDKSYALLFGGKKDFTELRNTAFG